MTGMIRFIFLSAVCSTILLFCSGCATQFSNVDAARIRKVAITDFKEPKYVLSAFFSVSFLPADLAGHPDFSDQMNQQNLHLGAETKIAIARELGNDGYEILEEKEGADAVLELEFGGFPPEATPAYSAGAGDYEPEFTAQVTLRDAATTKILFSRMYVYRDNSISPMDGSLLIRPDHKYGFKKALDIYGNPQLAAEGFRAGATAIAQSVGASLKK